MNKLIAIVAIAISSILSANAQNLKHIEPKISIQQQFEELNYIPGEAVKEIRNFEYMYSEKIDTTHHNTYTPPKKVEASLPAPLISDEEIAEMAKAADAYKYAKTFRLASSPTPQCSVEALRSIHNNQQIVDEFAYGKTTTVEKTKTKTEATPEVVAAGE